MSEADRKRAYVLVRLLRLRPYDYLCTEVADLLERLLAGTGRQ